MLFGHLDSYHYSRPVSYRSYNPRVLTQEVLAYSDPESTQVVNFLKGHGYEVTDLGGLARGIRFGDLEVGKRIYNHNSTAHYAGGDYYIHQWKSTNDLAKYHPTGTHITTKSFSNLINHLQKVAVDQKKTYK